MRFKHISKNDKDAIAGLVIALFVSCLFYYICCTPGIVLSRLDLLYFYLGVLMPFGLPIYVIIKNKKMEVIER